MSRGRTEKAKAHETRGIRGVLRDIAIAAIVVAAVFAAIFAYTQVYPPLVVVESESMQHSDDVSYVGVIDTGDLVFVQAARGRADVITWVEGRVNGHQTYGDYGDVIVFWKPPPYQDPTPVIHRAILHILPSGGDAYDVPALEAWDDSDWDGVVLGGANATTPYGLESVTLRGLGWRHDLTVTFDLATFARTFRGVAGYITMGDHNAYTSIARHDPWVVPEWNVVGRARGEVPWFGLLKLMFDPGGGTCCQGWGDPDAPKNSWDSLLIALPLVFASPFIAEGVIGALRRYVLPRFRRRRAGGSEIDATDTTDPTEDDSLDAK